MTTRGFSLVGLAALTAALAGCMNGAPSVEVNREDLGNAAQAITGGTPASGFPEAVLVDIYSNGQLSMGCSGSVIAPRVVLTAGHCVADGDEWQITAPYASGQKAHSTSSATYDWTQHNDQVSPDEHDVALIFLDSDITLTTYPTVASAPIADQSEIVTVGRVKGGQMSKTALYQSTPGKAKSAASYYGFKYDYMAPMVLEAGDSGGPAFAANTHTIVSVNSTGDQTYEIVARVDLLSDWIKQQIASHGGDPNSGQGGSDPGSGQGGAGQGGGGQGGAGQGGGGAGGSDPGGEGGGDPWGQGGGPGGWPPGGGPGGGWPPGGGPGGWPPGGPGQGHHCIFIPWRWQYYCW